MAHLEPLKKSSFYLVTFILKFTKTLVTLSSSNPVPSVEANVNRDGFQIYWNRYTKKRMRRKQAEYMAVVLFFSSENKICYK